MVREVASSLLGRDPRARVTDGPWPPGPEAADQAIGARGSPSHRYPRLARRSRPAAGSRPAFVRPAPPVPRLHRHRSRGSAPDRRARGRAGRQGRGPDAPRRDRAGGRDGVRGVRSDRAGAVETPRLQERCFFAVKAGLAGHRERLADDDPAVRAAAALPARSNLTSTPGFTFVQGQPKGRPVAGREGERRSQPPLPLPRSRREVALPAADGSPTPPRR